MTDTQTQPTEVTVSRVIAAPAGKLYSLFLDPKAMMTWFGMDGYTNLDCAVDARVGGAWHMQSRAPDGSLSRMEGEITRLDPGRRIVQLWRHVGAEGAVGNQTEADISFTPSGAGTEVTVVHRRILNVPELFAAGWQQSLNRLADMAD
ncbi:MAG: SRPBCC domain-containing protein [Pseudomonadota bacterium]